MSDSETIEVYNQQVEEYAELVNDFHEQSDIISFTDSVKPGGYILDLGCGPGTASSYFLKQGFRVDAVDASQEMVRVAQTQLGVDARCALFSDITSVNVYDGVWANFSLLHAKPEEFPQILAALHQAIKADGVFHIGMKLGEGSHRDHLGRYYSYYSYESLQAHLERAGFKVTDVQLGESRGLAGTIDPWILMLSAASGESSLNAN